MKPEQAMWVALRKAIGNAWHAQRHEDSISSSIPDVSYGVDGQQGWMELKVLKKWPKLSETIVKVKHLTPGQKAWLISRGSVADNCWLLLKVEDCWMLFHWKEVKWVGQINQTSLRAIAHGIWNGKIDRATFIPALTTKGVLIL